MYIYSHKLRLLKSIGLLIYLYTYFNNLQSIRVGGTKQIEKLVVDDFPTFALKRSETTPAGGLPKY